MRLRAVTVLTVLTGAVLIPYQLSEVEKVRELSTQSMPRRPDLSETQRSLLREIPFYDIEIEVCMLAYGFPVFPRGRMCKTYSSIPLHFVLTLCQFVSALFLGNFKSASNAFSKDTRKMHDFVETVGLFWASVVTIEVSVRQ